MRKRLIFALLALICGSANASVLYTFSGEVTSTYGDALPFGAGTPISGLLEWHPEQFRPSDATCGDLLYDYVMLVGWNFIDGTIGPGMGCNWGDDRDSISLIDIDPVGLTIPGYLDEIYFTFPSALPIGTFPNELPEGIAQTDGVIHSSGDYLGGAWRGTVEFRKVPEPRTLLLLCAALVLTAAKHARTCSQRGAGA